MSTKMRNGQTSGMYLISTGVLEQDNTTLLQEQTCLLGNEQVGTLDDVLEVGLSIVIDQARDVRDINSLGTAYPHQIQTLVLISQKILTDHHKARKYQP
jgi:hypothetical protein